MNRLVPAFIAWAAIVAAAAPLPAQERGAARLHSLMEGITVTPRVLVIGTHPDDDDADLMVWLSRGHSLEAGYLSLTRGEAGLNYVGAEGGAVLGAVRTKELLAARRIDGGHQFFSRAIDFGVSKNADETFKHWPREALVGDIVTVIRSFRPHVLISVVSDNPAEGGQHTATVLLIRDAYAAASDTTQFPVSSYGAPWEPAKLYRHGVGLKLDLASFDVASGRTLAELGVESRAQHRSQGLVGAMRRRTNVQLERVASRVGDSASAAGETSIFDGIDTSFARLAIGAPPAVAQALPALAASVDSARAVLDLARPAAAVPYLAHAARAAANVREHAPLCRHFAADAAVPMVTPPTCSAAALDLDAAIDRVRQRVNEALLIAAGVTFDVSVDREIVAETDTTAVVVRIYNHGETPVTLAGVTVDGSGSVASAAPSEVSPIAPQQTVIAPGAFATVTRMVSGLVTAQPWWMGKRAKDTFLPVVSSIDGLERAAVLPSLGVPGVSLPEELRRESGVTVSLVVDSAAMTTSLGPINFHYADPLVGLQRRPISGAPDVALGFDRGLEWAVAGKAASRQLRLTMTSLSDREQSFKLNVVAPAGVRLDSLPDAITLAPHERRDQFLQLHGALEEGRHIFGVVGMTRKGQRFMTGFRAVEYPYLPPIRIFRNSGLYLQAVNIKTPPALGVLYVQGAVDDMAASLRQIGVAATVVTADELIAIDLTHVTTVVLGPHALEAHPELLGQTARLMEFARKGGTVVVLAHSYIPSTALPFPVAVGRPIAEHVTDPDAIVTPVQRQSRVLTWPNAILADDWVGWSGERAVYVPSVADSRYATVIETHDADEKPNRNAILVASVGKGAYLYTTLTLTQQIAAGVPGAMRLFVNMLSYSLAGVKSAR